MSLYVREAGPSNAPGVLFLHGLGLSSAMWQTQFEHLADIYHCLAPDLPECGNSASIGPFTLKDASRRAANVIRERVPGGSAHVVGLSLGGAVALQMLRDEPQVVDRLLISGTARELPAPLDALRRLDEQIFHLLNHELLAEFLLQPYHLPQEYRCLLLSDLRIVGPQAIEHFLKELTKLRLPRNGGQVPTLIVVGQKEAVVTRQAAHTMSRTLAGARGALVPSAGHFWNREVPDLFTQTVRAWLEDEPLPPKLLLF
ncbi:MAG: alpha/beta hydrolase [Chloroflexota bacterium]|nr:alpha/beta hydrolase [Chloroflexota bacterium]